MVNQKKLRIIFNCLTWIFSIVLSFIFCITIRDIGFLNALCFSLTLFILFFTFANYAKNLAYDNPSYLKFRKEMFYYMDDINRLENKKKIKSNIDFLNECKTKFIFNKICKKNNKIEIENEMITYKEFVDYAKENPRKIDKIIRTNKIKIDKRFNGELYERYIFSNSSYDNLYKNKQNEISLITSFISLIPSINVFDQLSETNQSAVSGIVGLFVLLGIILIIIIYLIFINQIKKEQDEFLKIVKFLNNQEGK